MVEEEPPGEEERLRLGGERLHELKLGEPLPPDPAIYLLVSNISGRSHAQQTLLPEPLRTVPVGKQVLLQSSGQLEERQVGEEGGEEGGRRDEMK